MRSSETSFLLLRKMRLERADSAKTTSLNERLPTWEEVLGKKRIEKKKILEKEGENKD